MKKTTLLSFAAAALLLNGCATIIEGDDQIVHFDSDPTGAICSLWRMGDGLLYPKFTTPTSLDISKDKDEIKIICNKEGYEEKTVYTDSNFEGWTLGNLVFGGIIGLGVDAASGAINKYPSNVIIPLQKKAE